VAVTHSLSVHHEEGKTVDFAKDLAVLLQRHSRISLLVLEADDDVYAIVEHLVQTNLIRFVDHIQLEPLPENLPGAKYCKLRELLFRTHYPFSIYLRQKDVWRVKGYKEGKKAVYKTFLEPPVSTVGTSHDHCEFYAICTPPPQRTLGLSRRVIVKKKREQRDAVTGGKRRVLFLADIATYERSMDRGFFLHYRAALDHPSIEAHLWGLGFEHWRADLTGAANIAQRYGDAEYFDVVVLGRIFVKQGRDFGPPMPGTVFVSHFHEAVACFRRGEDLGRGSKAYCDTEQQGDIIHMANMTLVDVAFFAQGREMAAYAHMATKRLMASQPHDASPKDFEPTTVKDIEILISGSQHAHNYPLRGRFVTLYHLALLKGAQIYTAEILQARSFQQASHDLMNDNSAIGHALLDQQYLSYAKAMSRAKIVLVSVAVNNYALRKYTEAALAGALLIGDIPCERADEFREYVVEISRADTDQTIASVIEWWRTHDKERIARAEIGRKAAQKYSTRRFLDNMLSKVDSFIEGQRGLHYDYDIQCDIGDARVRAQNPEFTRTGVVQQMVAAVHNDAPFVGKERGFA
jgi:hypothetical protein